MVHLNTLQKPSMANPKKCAMTVRFPLLPIPTQLYKGYPEIRRQSDTLVTTSMKLTKIN